MAMNSAVLKQTLSFKSLRLLERKDLNCKCFSDSELMVEEPTNKITEKVPIKWKSESNINIISESLVKDAAYLSKNEPASDCEESKTKPQDVKENLSYNAVHSLNAKRIKSRNLNLMSVSSILQGILNMSDEFTQAEAKPPSSKKSTHRNKSSQANKTTSSTTEDRKNNISSGASSPNPLLEGAVASAATGENFLAEPRCLTLKKYNSSTDPFLTDDSLLFEPDFEDDVDVLEDKQDLNVKSKPKMDVPPKDMFFDDDEVTSNKKSSTLDREEGELSPEQHPTTSSTEAPPQSDSKVVLNAEFFNKVNECLRDIDKKCRELYSTSVPKHSIKPLQRILSNVDNVKRKLSFLVNSKNANNELQVKSNSDSLKYLSLRNMSKDGHEQVSKFGGDSLSKSSTKENEISRLCDQISAGDKGLAYLSKPDDYSQRLYQDSRDRHSRGRGHRDKPSQTELLNRKKISILEKLGTKQEIERIQSLFKRQMNLITQHVIQKKEPDRIHLYRKCESERKRRHSFHKQNETSSKNAHEKIDLSALKSLEDMEAFLEVLKNKTSDPVLAEKVIKSDKMKGSLKFTSKKDNKVKNYDPEPVVQKEKNQKATAGQPSGTGICTQPLYKDSKSSIFEKEAIAQNSKLSCTEEKENKNVSIENTVYTAKTHRLWEDDEQIELTKPNPICDSSSSKVVNEPKIKKRKGNGAMIEPNEHHNSNQLVQNQMDCLIVEKDSSQKHPENFTIEKTTPGVTKRDLQKKEHSSHLDESGPCDSRREHASKRKRGKEYSESESEIESSKKDSKEKRKRNDSFHESGQLILKEKQHLTQSKDKEKCYSESESITEKEDKHSNKREKKGKRYSESKSPVEQEKHHSSKQEYFESDSEIESLKQASKNKRKRSKDFTESESFMGKEKHRSKKNKEKKKYHSESESEEKHSKKNKEKERHHSESESEKRRSKKNKEKYHSESEPEKQRFKKNKEKYHSESESERKRSKKDKEKEKYHSESESEVEQEKQYSVKQSRINSSKPDSPIDKNEKHAKKNKTKSNYSESDEREKIPTKQKRRDVEIHSGSEHVTENVIDQEKQNPREKKKKEDYFLQYDSDSECDQEKPNIKRISKKKEPTEHQPMFEEEERIPKREQLPKHSSPFKQPKYDSKEDEEQLSESEKMQDSSENLTLGVNESLMRDLLSKKIYILGDESLTAQDSQFRLKVIGNEIYLKEVSNEGKHKRRSKKDSKLKSSESEHFKGSDQEQNAFNKHYKVPDEEPPIDPETVDSTLQEMESFLQDLRSKKKASDDEQHSFEITNTHKKEEKFLARIQAKRKAKLMACVSAAPYSMEKEAKFLKALEKRDGELSESSDIESHKQKFIEKLRAETDAIVLAQKSGVKSSKIDDDPLMEVKALLNMIKEAESTNDENEKQVYVSFQLKKSDMNKLENLTEKPSHLSEESQKLLNNLRAKMRAKKVPASNISSLMLKPEE